MIKIQWRCILLLVLGASAVHAQQGPVYYANPYYQGGSQVPAQRYYNPNPYGYYPGNAAPNGTYYAPPSNYYPASQGNRAPPNPGAPYPFSVPARSAFPAVPTSNQGGDYPNSVQPGFSSSPQPGTIITPSPTSEPYYPGRAVVGQGQPSAAAPTDDRQYVLNILGQRIVNAVDPNGAIREAPFYRSPNETFWISADYLASFARPMRMTGPLLTTGSINDAHPGALGQPSTAVLFGNNAINFNLMSGVSLNAGVFLDDQNRLSLEWGGFLVTPSRKNFSISSDANGNPLLTRPVFATDLGGERIFINSFPGQFTGTFTVENKSVFGGTEFNAGFHNYSLGRLHTEGLVGFRYLRLAESMTIQDINVTGINGNFTPFPPVGGAAFPTFSDQDSFATTNQFFGAQVGGRLTWEGEWFTFGAFTKFGLGATVQHVDINGSTTFISPTGNQTVTGGVLALSSNIGSYSRTVVGIVPEMGLDVGVNVNSHVRLHLGYSALLWNRVVRPGSQFDTNVNTGLAPTGNFGAANVTGPVAPLFRFNDEPYWIQSLKLGLELRY